MSPHRDLQCMDCRDCLGKSTCRSTAVRTCDIGQRRGKHVNQRKSRWIAVAVAGMSWGATIAATLIRPHLQVYLTIWLATLICSFIAVAVWMTRPDHGLLAHVRLRLAAMRLDEAIKEECTMTHATPDRGRLEHVA